MAEASELLSNYVETCSFLSSLFPLDGELTPDGPTSALLADPSTAPSPLPHELTLILALSIDTTHSINLTLALPLSTSAASSPAINIHQPSFLSRPQLTTLTASLASHLSSQSSPSPLGEGASEYLLEGIEFVREEARVLLERIEREKEELAALETEKKEREKEGEVRVWFWFPSLSTKEKRDDMVHWAPGYGLTGFVLAGKPALLCVEGEPTRIERYMSEIKAVSWADVPSFQKKVSRVSFIVCILHPSVLARFGRWRTFRKADLSADVYRSPSVLTCIRFDPFTALYSTPTPLDYVLLSTNNYEQVSERLRIPLAGTSASTTTSPSTQRVFSNMVEITDLISKGGHRGNRGEMGEVREWIVGKGGMVLGEEWGSVVGVGFE
ncbi:hypothetical protein MNV49_005324 [Pseudohyphozyma bogoriensis]|nr:hypothetical protein MNV49_005324 [Pseudohyphozyma bogoriensis]